MISESQYPTMIPSLCYPMPPVCNHQSFPPNHAWMAEVVTGCSLRRYGGFKGAETQSVCCGVRVQSLRQQGISAAAGSWNIRVLAVSMDCKVGVPAREV